MQNEEILKLIGKPENEQLEYKAVLPPSKTIGQLISAFANTKGGYIVLGVREKGNTIEVIGLSEDFRANSIVHKALDLLTPKPRVQYNYESFEGKRIYVIAIEKSTELITLEGAAYRRVGDKSFSDSVQFLEKHKHTYARIEDANRKFTVSPTTVACTNILNHYRSVLNIVTDLKSLLYPEKENIPTNVAEGKILMRILFSSCADNFETYLTDLLYEIYLAKPETLKSEEMVTVKEVLDCTDIAEFIAYYAKKKLGKLKRGSVTNFLEDNPQIEKLNAITKAEQKAVENTLQIRHVYAHNNGIADEKFIKHFPEYKVGEVHELSLDALLDYMEYLAKIVLQIDVAAMNKFNLSGSI